MADRELPAAEEAQASPAQSSSAAGGGVPKRRGRPPKSPEAVAQHVIHIRIDKLLQDALNDYMVRNGMTVSQAVRVLLMTGFSSEMANPEAVFHQAAFREGMFKGYAIIQERLGKAVAKAMQEIGREIGSDANDAP